MKRVAVTVADSQMAVFRSLALSVHTARKPQIEQPLNLLWIEVLRVGAPTLPGLWCARDLPVCGTVAVHDVKSILCLMLEGRSFCFMPKLL